MRWAFLLVFGGAGLAMLVGGVFSSVATWRLVHDGVFVKGTVLRLNPEKSVDSNDNQITVYRPVLSFNDLQGNHVEVPSSSASSRTRYSEGETIEIVYPQGKPHRAEIRAFSQLWTTPLVLLGFGLVLLPVGIFSFFQIKEIDDTFDTPFFKHRRKTHGRFIKVMATIEEVYAEGPASQPVIALKLTWSEPGKYQEHSLTTKPTAYKINGKPITADIAATFARRKIAFTYDPADEQSHYFDISDITPLEMRRIS